MVREMYISMYYIDIDILPVMGTIKCAHIVIQIELKEIPW